MTTKNDAVMFLRLPHDLKKKVRAHAVEMQRERKGGQVSLAEAMRELVLVGLANVATAKARRP